MSVDGTCSRVFPVDAGVRQGSVLSSVPTVPSVQISELSIYPGVMSLFTDKAMFHFGFLSPTGDHNDALLIGHSS